MQEPVVFANMLKNNNEITPEDKKIKAINLVSKAGNVTVMIGAKGKGKTATVFWMIEYLLKRKVQVYWYGYSKAIMRIYPQVIQTFDIKKVKNGILFVDEAAVFTSARNAMTTEQKEKVAHIFTCRHSDYSVVYVSQTFRIDITILNTMDVLWFKPFFNMDFDREEAQDKFSKTYEYLRPVMECENLVINCQENNAWFFENDLPRRWCEELSKPFARIEEEAEAIEYMGMLAEADMKPREMNMWMMQRGWNMNKIRERIEAEEGISAKKEKLKGVPGVSICYRCGSLRLTGKGIRKGKQRLECMDCGASGYEEKFSP